MTGSAITCSILLIQLCTSTKMLAFPVFSELMVAPKDDCFLSQVLLNHMLNNVFSKFSHQQ